MLDWLTECCCRLRHLSLGSHLTILHARFDIFFFFVFCCCCCFSFNISFEFFQPSSSEPTDPLTPTLFSACLISSHRSVILLFLFFLNETICSSCLALVLRFLFLWYSKWNGPHCLTTIFQCIIGFTKKKQKVFLCQLLVFQSSLCLFFQCLVTFCFCAPYLLFIDYQCVRSFVCYCRRSTIMLLCIWKHRTRKRQIWCDIESFSSRDLAAEWCVWQNGRKEG